MHSVLFFFSVVVFLILGDKIETMEAGCAVKTALICLSHSDHLPFNSVHQL